MWKSIQSLKKTYNQQLVLECILCCPNDIYAPCNVLGYNAVWPFRFVAISVCGPSGLWPFRSVALTVCGRFGQWPFRSVAVSVLAVSVCGRSVLWPFRLWPFQFVAVMTCYTKDNCTFLGLNASIKHCNQPCHHKIPRADKPFQNMSSALCKINKSDKVNVTPLC